MGSPLRSAHVLFQLVSALKKEGRPGGKAKKEKIKKGVLTSRFNHKPSGVEHERKLLSILASYSIFFSKNQGTRNSEKHVKSNLEMAYSQLVNASGAGRN